MTTADERQTDSMVTCNSQRLDNFRCCSISNNNSATLHFTEGESSSTGNTVVTADASLEEASRRRRRTMKFLLHCPDGAPPFLTPHLLQRYFPSQSNPHLVLGINMSDSCVVPLYHNTNDCSTKEKKSDSSNAISGIIAPTLSKRQQKKRLRKGGHQEQSQQEFKHNSTALESVRVTKPKPSGYTFAGRPLDTYFMIPKSYDTIVVPTWDLVDNASSRSIVSSVSSSSTGKIGLFTAHGRQMIDPTLFLSTLHGLKTAASCVLLYDDTATSSSNVETSISIRPKACTVERTCHFVDQIITKLSLLPPTGNGDDRHPPAQPQDNKLRLWIPAVGGDNVELRKRSVKEAVHRSEELNHDDSTHGVALIGLHRFPNHFGELLNTCIEQIPKTTPIAVPMTTDWVQIHHCMQAGVDIIGSSLPATLAKERKALVLDIHGWRRRRNTDVDDEHLKKKIRYSEEKNNDDLFPNNITSAAITIIDVRDVNYEYDTSPLLEGCLCYACQNHIRAYIHHLAIAKELLCEILLFVHNLHHILEWFKEFSEAIDVGLENMFIQHIQRCYHCDD